jgi:pyruvyltransferase
MTHRKLSSLGISSPKVFGDPALLLPHVYFPKIEKKFEIGIIPHYVDKNHSAIKKESQNKNIKIIDVQNKNIEQTICDIISCEIILSSSLHGLIVADAYSIPNFWIKMSNQIIGGNFKFHDYFLSVSRDLIEPAVIGSSFNFNKIIENNPFKTPKIDLTPLLKSNPFL